MALHPGEAGVCSIHGDYDEYCGPCAEAKDPHKKKTKVPKNVSPFMVAAEIVVLARLGDKYEIVGLGESDDNFSLWEVDVREKSRPNTKIETLNIPVELLAKVIDEKLTVDHLTGKTAMPDQVRADIQEQFDGMGDTFERREE
jgi:hypothetical protein